MLTSLHGPSHVEYPNGERARGIITQTEWEQRIKKKLKT
jgi:hypothetical protein